MRSKCDLYSIPKMKKKVNMWFFLAAFVIVFTPLLKGSVTWDSNGYLMYCPCMGRFGNQAEQFLGALRFAKDLNRTMVVPPWVAYDYPSKTSFPPYSRWFDFDELKKFHRVLPMRTFMEELAPEHWSDDGKSRKIYCSEFATKRSPDGKSCPAKIGNPFGPFWDHSNIDFTGGSHVYLHTELTGYKAKQWSEKLPPHEHPVITLMGAPGSFPITKSNRGLQKYVKWSKEMLTLADDFIHENLQRPFIGIHLRNGVDWVRACQHAAESTSTYYMGSAQCCGYDSASAYKLTEDMCLPPKDVIIEKVTEVAKLHNASYLYIATDSNPMLEELSQTDLKLVKYPTDYPMADLAILTMADAFIGNCVSTFTSFVVRDREIRERPNYFFAFDHPHAKIIHDDL